MGVRNLETETDGPTSRKTHRSRPPKSHMEDCKRVDRDASTYWVESSTGLGGTVGWIQNIRTVQIVKLY